MYSLANVFDTQGEPYLFDSEVDYLEIDFLTPFSKVLYFLFKRELTKPRFEKFVKSEKAVLDHLEDFFANSDFLLSPLKSLRTLTRGQAVCLYLTTLFQNYPFDTVGEILEGSDVVFAKTFLVLDESVALLSPQDRKKLHGDWLKKNRVKVLDELPTTYRKDVFYYGVFDDRLDGDEYDDEIERFRQIAWEPVNPQNLKLILQRRRGLAVSSVDELIEIISSKEGADSEGVITAHDYRFQDCAYLVKYLRGWTFSQTYVGT
jgi:hypothetical protein